MDRSFTIWKLKVFVHEWSVFLIVQVTIERTKLEVSLFCDGMVRADMQIREREIVLLEKISLIDLLESKSFGYFCKDESRNRKSYQTICKTHYCSNSL